MEMANFMANYGVGILLLQLSVGIVGGIINDPQDEKAFAKPANKLSNHINKNAWMASRQKRSIDQNCNTWSPWYDKNFPSDSNKNESEAIPQTLREQYCPAYGNTDEVQCKDDNGEPFVTDRIDGNVAIRIRQYQVTCTLINPAFKGCPNLALRFKCTCTNTLPASVPSTTGTLSMTAAAKTSGPTSAPKFTPSAVAVATHHQHILGAGIVTKSTTQHTKAAMTAGANPSTTQQHQGDNGTHVVESSANEYLNIGRFRVLWWIAVVVASGIMFILNLLLTVCLYKKLRNQLQHVQHRDKKIHPLKHI